MKFAQKITPNLWFDNQAEEAAQYYVSLFENSKVLTTARYGDSGSEVSGQTAGSVMLVEFQLAGQNFLALNGGPQFRFNEAVSFAVDCSSQEEVDYYWDALSAGGEEQPCGWVKDRYGVSWQVVPSAVVEMLKDPDNEKRERAMGALFQMKKIDIETLRRAYEGS
ncbi:MAG: VOC family protein [Thermoanaerobaculia bacterium]|nr:VOC family protein [Thermoanaerobaculia bacterium]